MIYLEKIANKLVKKPNSEGSPFLDTPRQLTFLNEDSDGNKGYFLHNDSELSLELDGNIIFFRLNELNIDGQIFQTPNDLLNYIYGI